MRNMLLALFLLSLALPSSAQTIFGRTDSLVASNATATDDQQALDLVTLLDWSERDLENRVLAPTLRLEVSKRAPSVYSNTLRFDEVSTSAMVYVRLGMLPTPIRLEADATPDESGLQYDIKETVWEQATEFAAVFNQQPGLRSWGYAVVGDGSTSNTVTITSRMAGDFGDNISVELGDAADIVLDPTPGVSADGTDYVSFLTSSVDENDDQATDAASAGIILRDGESILLRPQARYLLVLGVRGTTSIGFSVTRVD